MRVIKCLSQSDEEITSLFWSDVGLLAGTIEGSIHIWPTDKTPNGGLCFLGEPYTVSHSSLAVSSICTNSSTVFFTTLDGELFKFSLKKNDISLIEDCPESFSLFSYSEGALIGSLDGCIYFYSVDDGKVIKSVYAFDTPIVSIASFKNKIYVLSQTKVAEIDFESFTVIRETEISASQCNGIAASADGYSLIVATSDGSLRIIDTVTFKEVGAQFLNSISLNAVAQITDNPQFVATGSDGKIQIFNMETMTRETALRVNRESLKPLAMHPEEKNFAVAGGDNMITLIGFE